MPVTKKSYLLARYLWMTCSAICSFVFIILAIKFFLLTSGQINGKSMEPTYSDNDLFIINKLVYLFIKPKRHDIIQVINPETEKLIIKRVVGLPGEIVVIRRGKIFIQQSIDDVEQEIEEPYLSKNEYTTLNHQKQKGAARFLVGSNQYFVVGDNRDGSTDSRYYGPIHRSKIIGKVIN